MSFIRLAPYFIQKAWGGGLSIPGYFTHSIGEAILYAPDVVIESLPERGLTLQELWKRKPHYWGKAHEQPFSIECKWLAASDDLSVQVHTPGADEWWLSIQKEKKASVYAGLKRSLDLKGIDKMARDGRIMSYLQKHSWQLFDSVFIPGGMVHCIGKGNVVLEIKNNRAPTYRLWDKKRDSKEKRPLQISQALQAMNPYLKTGINRKTPVVAKQFADNYCHTYRSAFFVVSIYHLENRRHNSFISVESYAIITSLDNTCTMVSESGKIESVSIKDTFFLPKGDYSISGYGKLLVIHPVIGAI